MKIVFATTILFLCMVIQATAAEWAATLLALARDALWDKRARMVFFQHDEVIVHAREDLAGDVVAAVTAAGEVATRLVLGERGVRVPLDAVVATSYAAKGGAVPDEDDDLADDDPVA